MTSYGRLPTLNEQEILLAIYTSRMLGRPSTVAVAKLVERGFVKPEPDKLGRLQLTSVAQELVKFCINLGLMSSAATRQSIPPDRPAVALHPVDDDPAPVPRPTPFITHAAPPPPVIRPATPSPVVAPKPLVDTAAVMAIPPTVSAYSTNGYAPAAARLPRALPAPKPPVKRAPFVLTPLMRQMANKRK
jgi:hypothetical protein